MSKVNVESTQITDEDSFKTLNIPEENNGVAQRIPKRVLYFSDGTLEEFSTDDESDSSATGNQGQVLEANVANLTWIPWFWYHTVFVGTKALAVCDYLGETLANFFGIISPKYEYELEHYKRAIAEEQERRKEDAELGSFTNTNLSEATVTPIQSEPQRKIQEVSDE